MLALGATQVISAPRSSATGGVDIEFARAAHRRGRPGRLIAAVDSRGGQVVIHGWRTPARPSTPVEAVAALEPFFGEFLYTHVDLEGLMRGTDMDAIAAVRGATDRALTAAGGITTQDEIAELDAMGVDAVVGMAIYTGKLDWSCTPIRRATNRWLVHYRHELMTRGLRINPCACLPRLRQHYENTALALLTLTLSAGPAAAQQKETETVDRTIAFSRGGTLKLKNFSGDVRVTGTPATTSSSTPSGAPPASGSTTSSSNPGQRLDGHDRSQPQGPRLGRAGRQRRRDRVRDPGPGGDEARPRRSFRAISIVRDTTGDIDAQTFSGNIDLDVSRARAAVPT